jgi:hypothetical protein
LCVSGPLDMASAQAGQDRGSSAGLQRLITTQREQVARDRLDRRITSLPHGDTRREAWLACDAFSSAWIGSWPSERDALSPAEFREVIATYLGRESPAVRALAGRAIPCSQYGEASLDVHELLAGPCGRCRHQSGLALPWRSLTGRGSRLLCC